MDQPEINIEATQPLDSMEKVGFQLKFPRPVSERIDQLQRRGRRMNVDRGEVVAALICSRDWTAKEIEEAVLAYRDLRVRDVVLDVPDDAKVVPIKSHGPGRRSRSG